MNGSYWQDLASCVSNENLGRQLDRGRNPFSTASRSIVGVVAATLTAAPGQANPISSTQYKYYTISGVNAAALHQSMVVRGPSLKGDKSYAATEVTGSLGGSLLGGRNGCLLQNHRMKLDFTMRLPRLKSDLALNPELRAGWQNFERFVRAHEAVHRSIWLSCAAAVEAKVRAIRARNCQAARAVATRILNEIWSACAKRHDAFDAAQRHPLMRQPFIVSVHTALERMTSDGLHIRAAKVLRSRRRLGM